MKPGDKVIINFNKILEDFNHESTNKDVSISHKLNKNKLFIIRRINDNSSVELTEDIKPFSNYIHINYLINIREIRKQKLKKLYK